tara:strand:+ start:2053 stop:2499 length:447 start_codon:yes stop_codon:yes gene_type:complete
MSIKSEAESIRDQTTIGANTANVVGTNLVNIADDLILKQSEIDLNTAKVGITSTQSSEITANTAKVGYTESLVSANTDVVANTAKISFDSASSTKLGGIEVGAEVNTINSTTTSEPIGSDVVPNIVSLTQAEYDAGTKVATTFYLIVG